MIKKTVPDLKELFKQASEIAEQVPESMQEAAFNRALDLLTGKQNEAPTNKQKQDKSKAKQVGVSREAQTEPESPVTKLLVDIDSTQHSGLTSSLKVLDRALMVLQISLTHGVDGLTTAEIARILTEKFRISTTTNAVNMAIAKKTSLVNRVPRGKGYCYRIMEPGQQYLLHRGEDKEPKTNSRSKKSRKKKTARKTETKAAEGGKKKTPKKTEGKRRPRSSAKVGPKAAVLGLLESGYFAEPRTGPDIQSYLEKKRGVTLGTDQLRLAMLRLVRDEQLERDENSDGQYEYKQPSP